MLFQEGRAWIARCPRCENPVVEAHVEGMKWRLSTKGVPLRDALVIQKYERMVVNIWIGHTQLYATAWHRHYGRPDRGALHVRHACGAFN